jgi:anti-anti-sigma regulatory factor
MTPSSQRPFRVSRESGAVVVTVDGDLDLPRSIRLGATLGDLIDGQGNLAVGVDLRRVPHVDPRALGVFAAAARLASIRGGSLTVTGMPPRSPHVDAEGAAQGEGHVVQFYKSDALLGDSVRRHLEPAMRDGECVIVVATKPHRHLFEATLLASGVDVERARARSLYIDLDAEDTLASFMVDGLPDKGRFESVVGGLVARVPAAERVVRIYGEMVAVLWAEGNARGATALEDLWNGLRRSLRFSLLCAYPTVAFDAKGTSGMFRTICAQHLASA